MQKISFIFIFLFVVAGNLFSQNSNAYEELVKVVERERAQLPINMGEQGSIVNAYLEGAYYTTVCEINNRSLFITMSSNEKVVKKSIINQLSQDSDAINTARLLIACNKEIKYVYVYKPRNWQTEIIITQKDLKKLAKN